MLRAIFLGGASVGVLDLLDAFIFFGLRSGAQPASILHSIAAGAIGRDAALAGGVQTAALGLVLHFVVAIAITSVYVMASRVIPALRTRWIICGLAFGVLAYFVMSFAVVPLSKAGPGQLTFALPAMPVLINGLMIHAFGVGLPAAYFAHQAPPRPLHPLHAATPGSTIP
jgi:hypothetical protein